MKIFENQEMKNYSNMRVGGKAKKLVILEKKEEIIEVCKNEKNIFLLEMEQMYFSLMIIWIELLSVQKNKQNIRN